MLDSTSALATTANSSYGWWTKRIHIGPYSHSANDPDSIEEFEENLIAVIRHCPNVELFIVERPLGSSFGPILDALARYASRHLHTIHLNIPGESVSKIIWALSALPRIVAAQIDIQTDVSPTEEVARLGSAAALQLRLPYLQQLSLRGYVGTLLEQLGGWDLPSLRSFSLNNSITIQDPQDVVEFLKHHGSNLVLLDLNLKYIVDVPLILELCPNLHTFAFNADWRITPHNEVSTYIVKRPHQHITTIGLHGLCYAFGVGTQYSRATTSVSFEANYAARSNDLNMAALNHHNFPKLRRIRAVNRYLLEDLNESNGPSTENGGYQRWNGWWYMCSMAFVRLEDCTGQLLGTLPENHGDEDESDEESDDEPEDSDEDEDDSDEDEDESEEGEDEDDGHDGGDQHVVRSQPHAPVDRNNWRTGNVLQVPEVLTQLIQEVKAMNETRDEALIASIIFSRPASPSSDA
jgi:hypothetical protein